MFSGVTASSERLRERTTLRVRYGTAAPSGTGWSVSQVLILSVSALGSQKETQTGLDSVHFLEVYPLEHRLQKMLLDFLPKKKKNRVPSLDKCGKCFHERKILKCRTFQSLSFHCMMWMAKKNTSLSLFPKHICSRKPILEKDVCDLNSVGFHLRQCWRAQGTGTPLLWDLEAVQWI